MDGFEATRRIREIELANGGDSGGGLGESGDGTYSSGVLTPPRALIIGVTGNALMQDQRQFLAHGVDKVLTKPVDMEAVVATIRSQAEALQR